MACNPVLQQCHVFCTAITSVFNICSCQDNVATLNGGCLVVQVLKDGGPSV